MKYDELIVGAILGLLISIGWQSLYDLYFSCKYLKPLKGKYNCYFKDGKEAKEIFDFEITKVKGRTLKIKTKSVKGVISKSEVYFVYSKNGNGWYIENSENNEVNQSKHTFGLREIIIVSNDHINIWDKYSKDNSYENPTFNTVNKSYYCIRVKQ